MATRATHPVIRVTLDSNIYVSALQFGGIGARFLSMARAGSIGIDTSDAILAETIGVLRDKFGWDSYRLHFADLELRKLANLVAPAQTLNGTGDPDDNRILECAAAARSDAIVTYDKDLLRLGEYGGVQIVRAVDFLQRWQK
jgi:putative PIN family toxin of toxin-antitoxin system